MPHVVLLGNDINNLGHGYSWSDLLKDLIREVNAEGEIDPLAEQFPLFYEEIWAFVSTRCNHNEDFIKSFIADRVQNIPPNDLHKKFMSLDVRDILTTNYEFTLEASVSDGTLELTNHGVIAETRYSIFRHIQANDQRVWHIHGDAKRPSSIALGYEHYAGYLQNMRNYVVQGVEYKNFQLGGLTKRLSSAESLERFSWLDIFFTHDIHIVGLALDFVEIHLWWLLTYRARSQISGKLKRANRLYYYTPKQREDKDRVKLRLLKANGVDIVPLDRPNQDKNIYYRNVVRSLKNRVSS